MFWGHGEINKKGFLSCVIYINFPICCNMLTHTCCILWVYIFSIFSVLLHLLVMLYMTH